MKEGMQIKVTINEKGVKRHIYVDKIPFTIGRSENSDLRLKSDHISRQHLRISVENDVIWAEDLGSGNGTWIEKKKLAARKKVKVSEDLVLGLGKDTKTYIQFELLNQSNVESIPELPEEMEMAIEEISYLKVSNGPEFSPAHKEKLKIVDPVIEARVADKRVDAEKNILEQIKNLMGLETREMLLMATEEAQKIRENATEDAQKIRQNATEEALQIRQKTTEEAKVTLTQANDEAAQKLKLALQNIEKEKAAAKERIAEVESTLQQKVNSIQATVSEKQRHLEGLKLEHEDFLHKLKDLRFEEGKVIENISALNEEIKKDQIHIENEKSKLLEEKDKISIDAKKIEDEFHKLDLAERKVKAMIEIDTLEAKAYVAKTRAEAEKAENLKAILAPEIEALTYQKNQLSIQLNKIQSEIRSLENTFEVRTKEVAHSASQLDALREEQALVRRQIEESNVDFLRLKSALEEKERLGHKLYEEAKKEKEKIISQAKDNAEKIILKGEESLRDIYAEQARLKAESETIIDTATHQASAIKKEAEEYANAKKNDAISMLEALKVEIKNRQTSSQAILLENEERKRVLEKEISKLQQEKEVCFAETKSKSEEILNAAHKEAQEQKEKIESMTLEELRKLKERCDAITADSRLNHQNLVAKLEAEYKDNKQKLEYSLSEYRQVGMSQIKDMVKKAEEEIQHSRVEKAKSVSTNLYASIAAEMYKARNRVMDDAFIEGFSQGIKDMVVDTMLDKANAQSNKLQEILKTSVDTKGKERIFWKRVGIAIASIFSVVILLVTFPSIISTPKNAIIEAFAEQKGPNQADAYVQKKVEEAKLRMTFSPPTTPEYKASYVDNILYTTNFESMRAATAFQDKWILELNDYFINRLDVKDTTIIKFVSLESTLLRDLAKLKAQVDPVNPEIKIEEMRAREIEFREKLGVIFENPDKVSRYFEFSEKFWNDFYR